MKRFFLFFLIFFFLALSGIPSTVYAKTPIVVKLDNDVILSEDYQSNAYIDSSNRVLIPVGSIMEKMEFDVAFNEETEQVVITKNGKTTIFVLDSETYTIGKEQKSMDTKPVITEKGHLMIPVRYLSEIFGYKVQWNHTSKTVNINTKNFEETIDEAHRLKKVPILMYHEIGTIPQGLERNLWNLYISPEAFKKQLDTLKNKGYNTITLKDLYEHWTYGKKIPEKPIVLTFDDGYRSNYEIAYKELIKRDMVATFFIIADKIDNPSYLSKEMIKEMSMNQMEIASHTYYHSDLRTANLEYELKNSKLKLEEITGQEVMSLCYPYGFYDETVVSKAKEIGYEIGVTVNNGHATINEDRLILSRVEISYFNQHKFNSKI